MNLCLIDIGGTNIRYSFFCSNKKLSIKKKEIPSSKSFYQILNEILKEKETIVTDLVISAAGPKFNQIIKMTNQKFVIDAKKIKKKFNLQNCFVLNDLEAAGYYLDKIKSNNKKIIKKGYKFNNNQILVSPGTGLGLSLIINNQKVLSSEIGNSKFLKSEFLKIDKRLLKFKFSKIEDFLSGPGISNLYEVINQKDLSTPEIIFQLSNNNKKALYVVDIFLQMFAKFLAEISLSFLPGNGIFLSGSLIRELEIYIDKKKFKDDFLKQVNQSHKKLLNSISINVITKKHMSIFGCKEFFNLIQKDLS